MNDKEKAEHYYKALQTVLLRLEKHSASADSWRESRTFLIGYLMGTVGQVEVQK